MLIEACSRTRSTASDLVPGSFDLADRQTEECVEVPTDILFGRSSPAMSLDAKQLLKKGTKLFHDLYFKWTVEDEAIVLLGNQLSYGLGIIYITTKTLSFDFFLRFDFSFLV